MTSQINAQLAPVLIEAYLRTGRDHRARRPQALSRRDKRIGTPRKRARLMVAAVLAVAIAAAALVGGLAAPESGDGGAQPIAANGHIEPEDPIGRS